MGSYSGTVRGITYLKDLPSTGITLPSTEYPSGTVTARFNSSSSFSLADISNDGKTYTFTLYLCDSSGSNKVSLGTFTVPGGGESVPSFSKSVSTTALKGKALSITCTGNYYQAYVRLRGSLVVTVPTAVGTYSITISAGTGGTCTGPSSATPGSSVSLTTSASTGYKFSSYTTTPSLTWTSTHVFTMPSQAVSVRANFERKYAASTFSASNTEITSGAEKYLKSVVTITNAKLSELTHKVTWKIGSNTNVTTTSRGASSATYQVPNSWWDPINTGTSTTLTITVETLESSVSYGTNSNNYTVSVPSSSRFMPTAPTVAVSVKDQKTGFEGCYIKGLTGVTIAVSGSSAGEGASLSGYYVSAYQNGSQIQESISQSGNTFTINTCVTTGSIEIRAYARDSRGRNSSNTTQTITVSNYTAPSISSVSASRCILDGTDSETGTYASIKCIANYTDSITTASTPIVNSLTINSVYYPTLTPSQRTSAQSGMVSGTTYIVGNGNIDPGTSYTFEFTAIDSLGSTVQVTIEMHTAPYSIHVKNGGKGVAFGKASERNEAIEITPEWDMYYKGSKAPSAFSDVENKTAYTIPIEKTSGVFWFGLAYICTGNTSSDPGLYMVFIDTTTNVTVTRIAGSNSRTATGQLNGNNLTLTFSSTVYGGLRMITTT